MDLDNPFSGVAATVSTLHDQKPAAMADHPRDPQIGHLEVGGAQTIRIVHHEQSRLKDAQARHQAVEIHCHGITELDLSFIQLLLAAKRSADKAGKSLTLAAPAAGPLRAALERAGFLATDSAAFWLKTTGAP